MTVSGARQLVSGWGEAVEKRLNEGAAKGWFLVNTFAEKSMVYIIWDTQARNEETREVLGVEQASASRDQAEREPCWKCGGRTTSADVRCPSCGAWLRPQM